MSGDTPLDRASALAPACYEDPAGFAFEQRQILAPGWQVVAPASAVSEAGDCLTRTLGRVPVVITRNEQGKLGGFVNVCAHRAGPVATCDGRGVKRLQCAYHGWSYDLDGRLRGAPEMGDAKDFDRDAIRLERIDVELWSGAVWARFGDGPSLAETLAGIPEIVGAQADAGLVHHSSRRYEVAANWKVYVDNYLEGYHLPFVHPGLTQAVVYTDYRTELGDGWSVQRSPVPADTGAYGAGEGLYFFVYPNTMLNYMPGRLQTNRIVATGIDRCEVEFDFYYAPGAEHRAAEDLAFTDQIQEEDRTICEAVQTRLLSGAYQPGRLSPKREAGVWHWQNQLRRAYASAGRPIE